MATVIRNTDPLLASIRDAHNAMKAQVGSKTRLFQKEAADAAAATATAETVVFVAGAALTLTNVGLVPSAALTAHASDNATLTLRRKNADGTGSATVATLVTDVAGGDWTALVRKSMGALTNATLAAGQLLTLQIAKGGNGVVVPSFELSDVGCHLDKSEVTITAANASSLATSLTLVNEIRAVQLFHRADTLAHKAADAATIAAAVATDLATAQTLANELKADHNTHIASLTLHMAADGINTIATSDASDQDTLNTLLNDMKTKMNAHFASGPSCASIRLVDA